MNDSPRTYIIELSDPCVRLAGQLVHLFQVNEPDRISGKKLLEELIQQTDIVFPKPTQHNVFPDPLTAVKHARKFEPVYYVPV